MKALISFVILLLFVFTNNSEPCDPTTRPINDFNDCKGLEISAGKELCCLEKYEDSSGSRNFCNSYTKDEYKDKENLIQSVDALKDIICQTSTEGGNSENSENSKTSENSKNSENSEREKNSNSSKLISLSQTIFILFFLIF